MKLIVKDDYGRLKVIDSTISIRSDNSVVGIIFDNAAEFNAYKWNACPYKSSLETIKIASSQREENVLKDKERVNPIKGDTSGFTRLRSIDFGNSALAQNWMDEADLSWIREAFNREHAIIINGREFSSISADDDVSLWSDNSSEDSFSVRDTEYDDDSELASVGDVKPVKVTVPLAKPAPNFGASPISSSILSNPNPASRAETSGNPQKVSTLIASLKMSTNEALTSLTIHNANLLSADFSTLNLAALTTLDLTECKISLSALKQLTRFSPKLKTIQADNLIISCDSLKESNEFKEKFRWQGSPQFVKGVHTTPQSTSTADMLDDDSIPDLVRSEVPLPVPFVPYQPSNGSTPVSKPERHIQFGSPTKVDTSKIMHAVLNLYKDNLKTKVPFSKIEVITEPVSNTSTLMHERDKLIQSTGREVFAFPKLTNPSSGIDHQVQAKMILMGLGVAAVEVEDIEADTELPEISDLKFGKKNNNPALTTAIKILLGELLEARAELRPSSSHRI